MIPVEWQLTVPEGIDDERSRAFATLLEERIGGIPIERVLVWHTDTVVESALAHLAELLDVDMVAHGVEQTRVLLEQAVERLKRRGTPSAVEETLVALGLAGALVDEETTVLRDGSICRDGSHVHGWDGHWAVFWLRVEGTQSAATYATIRAQATKTKRLSAHVGTIFAYADMGGADVFATDDGFVLSAEDGAGLAIEVAVNEALATEDGFGFGSEDGALLAISILGEPVLVGWHRSDVSAYAFATEDLSVITTESGEPLIMLEAS